MRVREIPPLLSGIIHTALNACEGVRFHSDSTCRSCGGILSGYDERRKRFAVLLEDDEPCPVHVIIQRSYCRNCGNLFDPIEPFYPGTRIGSPVVDLCRSFSRVMPYSRASTSLGRMGVVVDRWSVRHYALMPLPAMPAEEVFGMYIPISIIALSTLAGTVREQGNPGMEDILMACYYPSVLVSSRIPWDEEVLTSLNPEKQQKITEGLASGFSRHLGIVIICSCILTTMAFGASSCFPDGLITLPGLDLEVMSMPGFGAL